MDYSIESSALDKLQNDCVIVGIYENREFTPTADLLDKQFDGLLAKLVDRGDIEGKANETLLLNYLPEQSIERIVLVGLGKKQPLTGKNYRKVLSTCIGFLKKQTIQSTVVTLAEVDVINQDQTWKSRQVVELFEHACYQFNDLKTSKNTPYKLKQVRLLCDSENQDAIEKGIAQGKAISEGIRFTRYLSDLPGNICTPTFLADQAKELAEGNDKLEYSVLEEADMEALSMGALLSVSRGSRQPAKLISLEYRGAADKDAQPIVLVGKGLTFDAGGISLKPPAAMDEMKYDMCGGATVFGAISAAAAMQLPLNIVGLVPSSENLPDGDANKPGDIVTSMSGQTIEILNTDAEGRLILCDTLTYAKKYNPEVIIDMATLTGACIIALGRQPSGLLSNDDDLCDDLIAASEAACDTVWRLPIWEEYQEQLKSNFADMANIGGRDAGTITAACFLSRYTEDYRWAHLDIAGTAWRSGNNKGATGRPVPLLCQYLLNRAEQVGA